ncbi:MAG: hypothetical protein AB2693_11060 [Candidatus Thiodiazotropha sp.]
MPQSQVDKPPKFRQCDDHPALVKDQFCVEHKNMICSSCSSKHTNCIVQSIEDVCTNTSPSETNSLYDRVKELQDQVKEVGLSVETNIKKVKEQRKSMLKEVQILYEKLISKVNKLYQGMQSEIEANYQSQILLMSQHQEKINAIIAKLESSLKDIERLQGKAIDSKLFLKMQESVCNINQTTGEFRSLSQFLSFQDLSFSPSKTIEEMLSISFTLGSVLKPHTQRDTNIIANDIVFPSELQPANAAVVPPQQSGGNVHGATAFRVRSLSDVKAAKQGEFKIKLKGDITKCDIKCMAITKDGRILMADSNNDKVKLFSPGMKFLSSVSVPDLPWDIAVVSDTEAIVTTTSLSLVSLDISCSQLRIKTKIEVPYDIGGITKYKNKFVVCSDHPTSSVKLIDLTGKVYWSVSSDQQGQPLFSCPLYLTSHDEGRSSTVFVTDRGNSTLTLLNGETGGVITRRQWQYNEPRGVTTDTAGNIYVCHWLTPEISVLSGDLSEEKILLSTKNGLSGGPLTIVHDDKTQQLLISYHGKDIVDSFKLS